MEEAEHLCDNIVIMDHGTILKEGTLPQLLGKPAEELEIKQEYNGPPRNLDELFIALTGRHLNE